MDPEITTAFAVICMFGQPVTRDGYVDLAFLCLVEAVLTLYAVLHNITRPSAPGSQISYFFHVFVETWSSWLTVGFPWHAS